MTTRRWVALGAASALALGGVALPGYLAQADEDTTTPRALAVEVPAGAVELQDHDFTVRLHPDFPQVVDYRLGDEQMAGRLGGALTSILVNEERQAVAVAAPVVTPDRRSAAYALTFPDLPGVSMNVVVSVADDTLRMEFTDLVDPDMAVNRIRIPDHDLVTVGSSDAAAQLTAGMLNVNRETSGDRFENVATTAAGGAQGSWLVLANTSTLAAAFDTNAAEDNTAAGTQSAQRVAGDNNRWQRQIRADGATKYGSVWSGTWTWLGEEVERWERQGEETIGHDADPYLQVKITGDANGDGTVDWQDAAIAARDITDFGIGAEEVRNEVVSRIPFNIVSQATHPFLRTLDDTLRISLATDNLAQRVLLKGYQDQGHDSAHPDYAGHYNDMAGGLQDLQVLADEGEKWNATFGVHVNATESYSEAHSFSEDLLRMPPQKAWGWMNQSYYIDGPKDLATGAVLDRFQEFWDERPDNVDWLYVDVYYPNGWEGRRLGQELKDQGWAISSEWSDKLAEFSLWSHWSQEENYGGTTNKGINSDVIRFVHNSMRDAWNPHPILSNSNLVDFEGWTGHNNYNAFIDNVWQRNLPVKFLQQSDIIRWEEGRITFANGTVATSDVTSIGGSVVPTDRTFTYDGAVVYDDGAYLLPWYDGGMSWSDTGPERLYHYNIGGGTTTWELTDAWKAQGALKLYELTDTGREFIRDVSPVDGRITLDATDGVAYVLYPTSEVPEPRTPDWGQGSNIADPGFFSGTLDAYQTTGNVEVEYSARGNSQALLGAGESSLAQQLDLPAGTHSAWAWIEIQPGEQRPVTVEVSGSGVTPAGHTAGVAGRAATAIRASTVLNATASDEKVGTYFQRVPVRFTSAGGPVTLTVRAGEGTAEVRVDDLRVVEWTAPQDADATEQTVYFQDFEHVDTGYWPFVTGATNRGGDARTQLARLHAPYSQKGWWGVGPNGAVVENGKLNDNVLAGDWSLMANNENTGEILKTAPGAIHFETGRRYRVSFDHQTTYADQYRVRLGHDVWTDGSVAAVPAVSVVLGEQRVTSRFVAEFDAVSCGIPFIAIDKLAGPNTQHNLTIDDLRVEDIGVAESQACLAGAIEAPMAAQAGDEITVTTTVTAYDDEVTGVAHELDVPEGWTAEVVTAGAGTLTFGETSTQTWAVTVPADAADGSLSFTGSGSVGGEQVTVRHSADVRVIPPLSAGESYLSDMQDRVVGSPVNGWGPVEWDLSNGEQGAGDGGLLMLAGQTHPKGIGVHAHSSIDFDLGAECTRFLAVVGVDDSRGTRGTVQFSVLGDGEAIGDPTPVLTGGGAPVELDLDITGVRTLTLRVTDGGDGNGSDHGNWALARVVCGDDGGPTTGPTPTVDPTATPTADPTSPTSQPTGPTTQPTTPALQYPEKLYQTPGLHHYNGREWFTRCEPYSRTFRCWTSIWSTQVTVESGAYVPQTGWHHNNLTYLPSARALWKDNHLGHTNRWTAADGREWYTECDTANTGRNGCRSYARSDVVGATATGTGGWTYSTTKEWVFNNIVLFN